ncbi:MAG: adenylate/guanylate cyclase domain-containing protein, partial [Geminicoccaceae bacterium]|nr:adenylate/guanylate cyclase domain-containing protein [Geminicoccaceae bacterium]
AAIWFCDLRGFTALSEHASRDQLLATLNDYFDVVAPAVEAEGGEILKFIGDGMLAMFPLQTDAACRRALQAALSVRERMAELNQRRRAGGLDALALGIALHVGEVMYGNIGSRSRLDFTVIGPAVNVASRIEGLSRRLGRDILLSGDFALLCPYDFEPLGRHALPGIAREVEVFTVPEGA